MAILEDDPARFVVMRECLAEVLPDAEAVFFEDAGQMIAWRGGHLGHVVLISLDHDLPLRGDLGRSVDCGTGRQVADYLASVPPTCPVIVHSSNDHFAPAMVFALTDPGWTCSRVYPCDDTKWIVGAWADQVRQYVRDGWIGRKDVTGEGVA